MTAAVIDSDQLESHLTAFHRDGFLVIRDAFDQQRIAELLDHLHRLHPEYVGEGMPDDYYDVGDRRFTAPLRYAPPFDCTDLITHPLVDGMLRALLGARHVIEAYHRFRVPRTSRSTAMAACCSRIQGWTGCCLPRQCR